MANLDIATVGQAIADVTNKVMRPTALAALDLARTTGIRIGHCLRESGRWH